MDAMPADVDPQVARARQRVGQVLRAKWRLDRLIGVGGMAAVYAGTHRNGMRGAVKMLHPEVSTIADIRDRFLREGYAANRVDHPGVVRVLDDDVAEDGSVFVAMELLDGQTVDALAESRPGHRVEVGEVLAIADLLLDVLASAHEKGIVHRDLKPENLFLTKKNELKVLDFGIARLRELQGTNRATTTGTAMGTPAFMPPEQASGKWNLVDGRSDLWAVGATMFTLLSGRLVHQEETVQLLLAAAMMKTAPSLATAAPDLPRAVIEIVDHALAYNPEQRWPDARMMQAAVRAARQDARFSFPMIESTSGIGPILSPSGVTAARSAPAITVHASRVTPSPMAQPTAPSAPRSRAGGIVAALGAGAAMIAGVGWFVVRSTSATVSVEPSNGGPIAAASNLPIAEPAPAPTLKPTSEVTPAQTAAPVVADAPSAEPSTGPSAEAAVPKKPATDEPAKKAPRPVAEAPRPVPAAAPTKSSKHEGMY